MIVIDSDAHSARTLGVIRYGVATARRGWLTKENVANTRTWKQLAKLRKRARSRALRLPGAVDARQAPQPARCAPARSRRNGEVGTT